jgi:primosomal protein N' (replication factor Y)
VLPAVAESERSAAPQFAEIAVPLRVAQTFTYRLPVGLQSEAQVGARVRVSFGRQSVTGYIVDLRAELDAALELDETALKEVEELLDAEPLLTPEVLQLTRWIAAYYASPWGEVLKSSLPAGLNATSEQILDITEEGRDELARLPPRRAASAKGRLLQIIEQAGASVPMRAVAQELGKNAAQQAARELARTGWISVATRSRTGGAKPKRRKMARLRELTGAEQTAAARQLSEAQQRVIAALIEAGGALPFADLVEIADVSAAPVNTLEKRGLIAVTVEEVRRDPLAGVELPRINDFPLTDAQTDALRTILAPLHENRYAAFLLHGVTGSGKTEVYIRAMRDALEQGRSALMLVPEIALTPVFSRRLRAWFGDAVAILHSSLSAGERFDEWSRIRRGEARVVIGTRSAIFAPVWNLGLIVVDEEHEATYRQQESPYYHARDAAVVRAHNCGAVVVLGSATPSLESFHNAKRGKYNYLQMPDRVANRPLAVAEIVDMRQLFPERGQTKIFSDELLEAIQTTHERGEQSIILLNRRGFSSFVLCRSCGEAIRCPECDVTLTYHRRAHLLVCHYCNHRERPPRACPSCNSKFLHYVGEGTEQLETLLQERFPDIRIARLDRDTTARRKEFERAIMSFGAREIDMLVGTQMLAKGHDFPNVTLVGVISVDAGLGLPDFRAAERTFQLLTQVAGRAGRGELAGRVVIQTFHPEHYALRHARSQDYEAFYAEEMRYRQSFNFPPYVALAALLTRGENFDNVQRAAATLKTALEAHNTERLCRVLGPAPAPIARIKGEHRIQILIKARNRAALRKTLDLALADAQAEGCDLRSVNVEIDPVNLL